MSANRNFKWNRVIPTGTPAALLPFRRYNIKPMRQIPTLIGTAIAGGGATPVITTYVPGSSWATGKNLFIRGFYQLTLPAGPMPPFYNILESLSNTQALSIPMLIPPHFVPVAGTFSTWIQRNIVNVGPDLWATDLGDAMRFNFANFDDNQQHVIQWPAAMSPYDFSAEIDIGVNFQLPPTIPGATLTCLWAEAFLEQPGNLGALP